MSEAREVPAWHRQGCLYIIIIVTYPLYTDIIVNHDGRNLFSAYADTLDVCKCCHAGPIVSLLEKHTSQVTCRHGHALCTHHARRDDMHASIATCVIAILHTKEADK